MIVIDAERIFSEIRRRRPVSVAINGPDGILPQVQDVAEEVTRRFGIPAYVLADTTWGTCDLNQSGARTLAADLLFNVGHTVGIGDFGDDTILVDAFDDISFDPVVAKCVELLRGRDGLAAYRQPAPQPGAARPGRLGGRRRQDQNRARQGAAGRRARCSGASSTQPWRRGNPSTPTSFWGRATFTPRGWPCPPTFRRTCWTRTLTR